VAILHLNSPGVLSKITSFFGDNGLNIDNMQNNSKGEYAYTLLDLSQKMPRDTVQRLKEINGVIRVRRVFEG
ncbi:MAG: ACT domain-containing protein, partial [Solobacterium sp.]|nr:ACT domain-containing protein [Solobacterium sp.]